MNASYYKCELNLIRFIFQLICLTFICILCLRSAATLIPIVKRFVKPGAIIFTDGWRAYHSLNREGFTTFTVVHSSAFMQMYFNQTTSELVIVHTNSIEAAWSHAKMHFKRINGILTFLFIFPQFFQIF